MCDRHPRLRVGTLECGQRLAAALAAAPDATDRLRARLGLAQMGRVFCGIDFSEGVEMTRAVTDLLGDHVLMFESDYPHPEIIFPDHADTVIAWRQALDERATQRLMWENAARFFRLASTPWAEAPAAR